MSWWRLAAVGTLIGVLCLAFAVLGVPGRYRPRRAALATTLALLLVAIVGFNIGRGLGGAPAIGLLKTAWPALFVILVAVGLVALSGWRGDRRWFVPAGAALVAVAAIVASTT